MCELKGSQGKVLKSFKVSFGKFRGTSVPGSTPAYLIIRLSELEGFEILVAGLKEEITRCPQ